MADARKNFNFFNFQKIYPIHQFYRQELTTHFYLKYKEKYLTNLMNSCSKCLFALYNYYYQLLTSNVTKTIIDDDIFSF